MTPAVGAWRWRGPTQAVGTARPTSRHRLGTGQAPCWPHTRLCSPSDLPHSRPHSPAGRSGFHQVAQLLWTSSQRTMTFSWCYARELGGPQGGAGGARRAVPGSGGTCTSAGSPESTVGWAAGGTPGQVSPVSRGPELGQASAQGTTAAGGPWVAESDVDAAAFLVGQGAAAPHGRSVHIQLPAFPAPPQRRKRGKAPRRKRCGLSLAHRPAAAPRPHPVPASPACAGPARTAELSRSLWPPWSSTAQTDAHGRQTPRPSLRVTHKPLSPHRSLPARSPPALPGRVELVSASRAQAVLDRDIPRRHMTPLGWNQSVRSKHREEMPLPSESAQSSGRAQDKPGAAPERSQHTCPTPQGCRDFCHQGLSTEASSGLR